MLTIKFHDQVATLLDDNIMRKCVHTHKFLLNLVIALS